jgi:hypothetical protein
LRTIIAGPRFVTNYQILLDAVSEVQQHWTITTVISGTARGVDSLGERWAKENGIPLERYPADWERYGRTAGPIRNREMAEVAEALLAIWDGKSTGTGHMIRTGQKRKFRVHIHYIRE